MLQVGDQVPDLDLPNYDGQRISLASLRGRPVVLYFFPKAGTYGCTIETKGFVEGYDELERRGATVIGVSVDGAEKQGAFARECQVRFPLIADRDGTVTRAFGVRGFLGLARRVTFLIDADGRIAEVVEGMRPGPHVEAALRRLPPAAGDRPA